MRVFFALDVPPAPMEAASGWADRLAAHLGPGSAPLRWTRPHQRHVTLHFLGQVDEAVTSRLVGRLASGLPLAPFDLHLEAAGCFPAHGPPRVLWLGAGAEADALARLHAALVDPLRALALPIETRPFHAHVTMARVPPDAPRALGRRLRTWCAAEAPGRVPGAITAVTCYESLVSPAGSTYRAIARIPLIGGA